MLPRKIAGLDCTVDFLASWPNPSRPFITYYDVDTGERTELSGITTRNWVSKAANLLVEDCDAGVGTRVQLSLPTHWMRMVWLLATWAVGATVVDGGADIAIAGPDLDFGDAPLPRHRLATALRPLGVPFDEVPTDVLDLGRHLPGQPDVFVAIESASPTDPALELAGRRTSFAELEGVAQPSGDRLARGPGTLEDDTRDLLAACSGGGSLVLVTGASPERIREVATQERAVLR
jgi:uncharacterized protein (TIGR03089 family)